MTCGQSYWHSLPVLIRAIPRLLVTQETFRRDTALVFIICRQAPQSSSVLGQTIIYSLGNCADLAESLQYERRRQSSASSTWKWWKQPKPNDVSDQSIGSMISMEAEALCQALVDGANQLGEALLERYKVDGDRFSSEHGQPHASKNGSLS